MPMHKAPVLKAFASQKYPQVKVGIVDWYNSVIRLESTDRDAIKNFATDIINEWEKYTDQDCYIFANTDGVPHNSLSPVERKTKDVYIIDMILRNNITNEQYPDGVYHVHPEYQNIKSESIGLIEAMGMFILPGRLDRQLKEVESYLKGEKEFKEKELAPDMKIHAKMIKKLIKEHGSSCSAVEASLAIKEEVNEVCANILDNTSVFKKDAQGEEAFDKFLASVNIVKA